MNYTDSLTIQTQGPKFYDLTKDIHNFVDKAFSENPTFSLSGNLYLFIMHTSAALTISENYDSTAKEDLQNFMKYIAPNNLSFLKHTTEGPDDSPSHIKSILLNQNLFFLVENKKLVLGTWQGIFLSEFRDAAHTRKIVLKYIPD
jgi:secondary thiamine-phosphate synthase enzyme